MTLGAEVCASLLLLPLKLSGIGSQDILTHPSLALGLCPRKSKMRAESWHQRFQQKIISAFDLPEAASSSLLH